MVETVGHEPAALLQNAPWEAGAVVAIAAGDLHLKVAPALGGAITAFYSAGADGRARHWLRPASAEDLAARRILGTASFPLVPWCNRIRDGRGEAAGRSFALAPNHPGNDSPHPLHGIGWQSAWRCTAQTATSATLEMRHAAGAWPWDFTAWQHLRLDATGLACTIALRNDSDAPMPAGIGHHPYFPHPAGTRLQVNVARMWAGDAACLPTGLVQPAFLDALRAGMPLSTLDLDNNFTGWDRRFDVDWPDGSGLVLTATAPMDFFVLYCPSGVDHFCAEPVSNCTDWINLQPPHGPDVTGGTLLKPGAVLEASFRLQPRWPAAA